MQLFIHAGLRISLSLILSFTTASFIELEIFRQDTSAYIKNQNLIQNREVVIDANRLIDTQINHTEKEIAKLNSDAKNVIEQSKIDQIALKSPIETQIKTLFVERELKQQRVEHLSEELDCQIINEGMEESGGIRCDGVLAIAGTQTKHRIAGELANHARAERALAQEEINRIDFEVKRLQGELKSLINDDVGQQQLNAIKSARVKALSELDTMLENRDKAVAVLSQENPAFVPMPDGLLIRGEALAALIDSSPWLAARVLLIMLSLVVLDLAAIFVISVQPAPGSLTMSEVLVSEVVIFESLAEAELAVFNAKRRILETREQATETENAVDQRVKSMEQERQMRRAVADQFERELAHC